MKVFIYARKSTDAEDKQVLSIESQLNENQKIILREGLEVVETFIEKKSAKQVGRLIFNDMIKRIKKGEVEAVVCWRLDRLARNGRDAFDIIDVLEATHLKKIFTFERTYENKSDDKFLMGLEFLMAKKYVDDLRVNVMRGMKTALEKGQWVGIAPYGYRWRNKEIVIDEEKADVVRRLFKLYASGDHSMITLSEEAKKLGLDRGRGRIQSFLRNPFYAGMMEFRDELYQGNHDALIPHELWQRVQDLIERKRIGSKSRTKHQFNFRGILTCGECGCSFTAERQKGHVYYRCTRMRGKCSQRYLREEALEDQVTVLMQGLSVKADAMEKGIQEMRIETTNQAQRVKMNLGLLNARIEELQERKSKLLNLYMDEKVDSVAYNDESRKLTEKISRLQSDVQEVIAENSEEIEEAAKIFELLHMLLRKPKMQKPELMGSFSKLLYSNLVLRGGEIASYSLNETFTPLLKMGGMSDRASAGDPFQTVFDFLRGLYRIKDQVLAFSNLTC